MKNPGIIFFDDVDGLQHQRYAYVAWRIWLVVTLAMLAWVAITVRKPRDFSLVVLCALALEAGVMQLSPTRFQLWNSSLVSQGVLLYMCTQAIAYAYGVAASAAGSWGTSVAACVWLACAWIAAAFWRSKVSSFVFRAVVSAFAAGILLPAPASFLLCTVAPATYVIVRFDTSAKWLLACRVAEGAGVLAAGLVLLGRAEGPAPTQGIPSWT